ncbi:MAG: 2Fe-2S iron-sulfur cluster binding domain-containing protein [Saprospiraceae bacterium]|nr:2Fe-2S iron-sulfur cluster binding domain-containing protein [Saprospiraceae bacterium]
MKNDKDKSSKNAGKGNLSRRGFLRGAGLTTAGTVMLNSSVLAFESQPATGKAFGPDAVTIEMKVNGELKSLIVEPRTTLATALRDHLGLTGTKVVCDRGACSACTVWLDGRPVNSCMTLALDVGSRPVETIEGLAEGNELHPLQEAFIEHDASQCGYCTPGMIMSAAHLLKTNPNPTLQDVKKATRGNLCRCGTYPHVFKATLAAAKKMK